MNTMHSTNAPAFKPAAAFMNPDHLARATLVPLLFQQPSAKNDSKISFSMPGSAALCDMPLSASIPGRKARKRGSASLDLWMYISAASLLCSQKADPFQGPWVWLMTAVISNTCGHRCDIWQECLMSFHILWLGSHKIKDLTLFWKVKYHSKQEPIVP